MKRLIAIILATACVFSLTACDLDPSSTPEATNGSVSNDGNITPGQSIVPGGDDTLNSDGTLKIPDPTGSISFAVDASTWQSILSEDAVRTAMKDNSITTLTSASGSEQYQMFYCADGRYGSIQKGNIYSESICGVQDGTVYVFNRSSAEGSWTRTTYAGSYDEYVSNHYVSGAMQFLSGAASAFDRAQYVETEKAYVIEQYKITPAPDVEVVGKLKVQFADEKLYSITLYLDVEGESGALSAVFGAVPSFDLPTDFESQDSSISVSPGHTDDHQEPPEATCTEQRWQQLFTESRLLNNLMDNHSVIQIDNGLQQYTYQLSEHLSQIVISSKESYQEILINRQERFQRDSKNGQWMRYSGINHTREYDTILNDKTAVLTQLLTPLKDLYKQASFTSATHCFTLSNVSFEHSVFGAVTAEYAITIHGGMIEEIKATIVSGSNTWKFTMEHDKSNGVNLPTDYVDVDDGKPGKK